MDVARINLSHGNRETHAETIASVRRVSERQRAPIPILADLQGPKIRIGLVADNTVLHKGQDYILTTRELVGNEHIASASYDMLPQEIGPGNRILIDDGMLVLRVRSVEGSDVHCTVVEGGALRSRKGINLPDVSISAPSLTEKDHQDLAFALKNSVDFVALSFVRRAQDISDLRSTMHGLGECVPIIAKIERPEAIKEIDAIIEESDGIMVARGDLGVEMPSEEVPLLQKMIIQKTIAHRKPVITATQMLESMISNPRPTRAESSDVANAVLDGTSAVMLSAETSMGKYPVESVWAMSRIINAVELKGMPAVQISDRTGLAESSLTDVVARAACLMARELGARAIVSVTHSGLTTRCVASYRPQLPILGVTDNPKVVRIMNLYWGVRGILLPTISDTDTTLDSIAQLLKAEKWIAAGDCVIYTAGMPLLMRGMTNMLKVSVAG